MEVIVEFGNEKVTEMTDNIISEYMCGNTTSKAISMYC